MLKQLTTVLFLLILTAPPVFANDTLSDVGPLNPAPSQVPSIYRLGYQPDSVSTLDPGEFKFRLSATHANYWFSSYNYLMDGEIGQFSLKTDYGIAERFEIGVQFRLIWQGGGVFDSIIEGFHHTFGFWNQMRELVPRNNLWFRNWETREEPNWQPGLVLNDITFSGKFALVPGNNKQTEDFVSIRTDLRFPVKSVDDSFGFQSVLQSQLLSRIFDFFFSIGFNYHKPTSFFTYETAEWQYFGLAQIRIKSEQNFGVVVGILINSRSIKEEGIYSFSELAGEIQFGVQWRLSEKWLLQLAAIEDGISFGNEPDVAFHFSLTFYFKNGRKCYGAF